MESLPQDWLALMFLVFTLGVKHGLDADHLATMEPGPLSPPRFDDAALIQSL